MPYAVEWISDARRFAELEPEWDGLLGEGSLPFDRHRWYAAWWEAFGAGREPAVCVVHDEHGALAAAMPLMRGPGGRLEAMANSETPVFRPVASGAPALRALADAVMAQPGRLWLSALPADGAERAALEDAAARAGRPCLAEPADRSPIVSTVGSFDDWRTGSKPRWGAPIERFGRKMTRDHDARFSIAQPPEDLEQELARGFAVEGSGWKAREGTAILSSAETTRFYEQLAASFAELGELRLSEIVLDGSPVAFDLLLLHRDRLFLLKTGIDDEWRRLAPGLVLRLATIERCFEEGWEAHELLGQDTEWKLKFSTSHRDHVWLRVYETGPRGRAARAYRTTLRPLLKAARERVRSARSGS